MPQSPLPTDLDALPLEMVALSDLHPHPRNYQEHPPEELAHIRHSLQENGFYRNIVIAEDNTILAGHGVVQAAQQEGYAHIPVRRLPVGPEHPRAMRVLVGDNEMARLAVRDEPSLHAMLEELRSLDVAELVGTGFDAGMLDAFTAIPSAPGDDNYSRKVEAPLYEPTGPQPALATLYSTARTDALLAEIEAAPIAEDEKTFLRHAARRHTVFSYKLIAEYYAHASATTQRLMENSALVIIDFDRAIELGYVKLSEAIAAQYADEYPDAD